VCDLGLSPVSNAFVRAENLSSGETFYPLKVMVCDRCLLAQLASSLPADTHFHSDYAYFSSFSNSWLQHSERYAQSMISRLGLGNESKVLEVASNDGYLLQFFVERGIPALGIEPTASTAAAARNKGVDTREIFFGRNSAERLAEEGWKVDLLIGNNVLAHVPDINDFVGGLPLVLNPEGVVTFEFPHLLKLIELNQFDTIYHEHYYYLSLTALLPVFARVNLRVFDVEKLTTHGGSLRLYLCHARASHLEAPAVQARAMEEQAIGLTSAERLAGFGRNVERIKRELLAFLIGAANGGQQVAAYGAAAKGNTLLNYCGVRDDMIAFVADKNPAKQGRFLPGSRIPVVAPDEIEHRRPDYLLILPWNIKEEIMLQNGGIRAWGGQFVVPIPSLEILP